MSFMLEVCCFSPQTKDINFFIYLCPPQRFRECKRPVSIDVVSVLVCVYVFVAIQLGTKVETFRGREQAEAYGKSTTGVLCSASMFLVLFLQLC